MKVSLNTIKRFINVELPPVDELVQKINQQLGGVEEVIDLGAKYKDALIVVVAKCEEHPDADRLSVCMIDDGGVVQGIERDEFGLIQVVCGAPNVKGGMLAIWLPPKSTVPASFDDAAPFVLESRELRGVISNGMLAAADELAIGSDHEGIVEITEHDMPQGVKKSDELIGKKFADVFGLNDTIIDIENKMFTHRPDCFGQLGVAREIAGIQHHALTSPEWYSVEPNFSSGEGLQLSVANEAKEEVPRFMALGIKNVEVKPSPLWLQCALVAMGSKPINNIVDITNYLMLVTAQPLHAYDYDKLRGHKLGVRFATKGETIHLLNDKTYELTKDDIVIVDGEGPVGLGGIMGGGNSEVSDSTQNIVLEAANFDMYTIRKTSMRHGLFTDAVTRFNKGQSSLQQPFAIAQAMALLIQIAGGDLATEVFDKGSSTESVAAVTVSTKFINERLGLQLRNDDVSRLLTNVEFDVQYKGDDFVIKPPYWRTDVELPEDIVEEVGRLYGFDRLARELPQRSMKPAPKNSTRELESQLRRAFEKFGANEVLTYSFVHERVIQNAQQNVDQALRLSNALSPDLQYYRLSVLPSLLDKVHMNIKAGHDEFALYEIGKGHNKHSLDSDGLPYEFAMLDAVYASKKPQEGAAYYHVADLVRQVCRELNCTPEFVADQKLDDEVAAPFEPARTAAVVLDNSMKVGLVGELKQEVLRAFKLPEYTAAISLDLSTLHKALSTKSSLYRPLSKYPSITQDISLQVGADTAYSAVYAAAQVAVTANPAIRAQLAPVSIYQSPTATEKKTITLRITAASDDRTLTDEDATKLLESIQNAVTVL